MEGQRINFKKIEEMKKNILDIVDIFSNNIEIIDKLMQDGRFQKNIEEIKNTIKRSEDLKMIKFEKYVTLNESAKQYNNFISNRLLNINQNGFLLDTYTRDVWRRFFEDSKKNIYTIDNYSSVEISNLKYGCSNFSKIINEYIEIIIEFKNSLELMSKFKDIPDNIVILGRNGSGKSSLARAFKKIASANVVSLSAQRILYYKKRNIISNSGDESKELHEFQQSDKLINDSQYLTFLTSDMEKLMTALVSEHLSIAVNYKVHKDDKETRLEKVVKLWNGLIKHRQINIDKLPPYVKFEDTEYEFNELSDGEKTIFYFIGHVLTAQNSSYIIVDEPENHLHPSICNKLWDVLEEERKDCKFIYITHNLSFASSRNATILWNKNFVPPYNWEFEIIPKDDNMPDQLILEILGSGKRVCFCEGEKEGSYDYKLYSEIFPELTIIPVKGHRQVIETVIAVNNLQEKSPLFENISKSIGIIDGDYHTSKQKKSWEQKMVYSLPVNEIENIFLDEDIINYVAKRCGSEKEKVGNYFKKFWKELEDNKKSQALNYTKEYIQYAMKEISLKEKNDIEKLIDEHKNLQSEDKIRELYNNKIMNIDEWITNKDYDSAIKFVDFKKFLFSNASEIVSDYPKRVINFIKGDPKLRSIIRKKYFNHTIFKKN